MSKTEKIRKLANAIRRYRGISQPVREGKPVEWIVSPRPHDETAVKRWLTELKQDVAQCMEKINGFTEVKQFEEWIKGL